MTRRTLMGKLYRFLGRCYYCGHREEVHKVDKIRECRHRHCDCFGWDEGPEHLEG